jgi:hypothetical protein
MRPKLVKPSRSHFSVSAVIVESLYTFSKLGKNYYFSKKQDIYCPHRKTFTFHGMLKSPFQVPGSGLWPTAQIEFFLLSSIKRFAGDV